jgi:hypothetical protein
MNEAAALEGVETERAKQRQAHAGKSAAPGRSSQKQCLTLDTVSEKGRTTAAIGKKIGVGKDTASKALKVKRAVDTLNEQGKTKEAAQVVYTLNKKGFHSAYKQVQEKGLLPPKEEKLFSVKEQPKYITLDYWQTLNEAEQDQTVATAPRNSREGWDCALLQIIPSSLLPRGRLRSLVLLYPSRAALFGVALIVCFIGAAFRAKQGVLHSLEFLATLATRFPFNSNVPYHFNHSRLPHAFVPSLLEAYDSKHNCQ